MKLPRSFPIPRSRGMRSLTVLVGACALFGGIALSIRPEVGAADLVIAEPQPIAPLLAELPSEFETDLTLNPTATRLKRRETLSGLTDRLGLDRRDAALALASLTDAELLDPRRVRAGLEVTIWQDADQLTALKVTPETGRQMIAKRGHDDVWRSFELKAREVAMPIVVRGTVQTSLYVDALEQGAGDQQVVDFAQVFAYDVDFQREVHPGDEFEFVYEAVSDERGNPIRAGNLIYAALNGRVVDKSFYRFTPEDTGETDYFQGNGESATRFLMKTPINGARLSSRFGNRRHPISGYTRLHKGTDFAAPTGTPIYAAGHGTVERASRYGGYGHYVRIRHANGYKTAYAHMSRYGRGVRKGTRVRQGQVIGYVGSTGASTGPHLHYEVYINGKPVDAMRLKLPTGRKLAGSPEIMTSFETERARIDAIRSGQNESGDDLLIAAAIPGN